MSAATIMGTGTPQIPREKTHRSGSPVKRKHSVGDALHSERNSSSFATPWNWGALSSPRLAERSEESTPPPEPRSVSRGPCSL